MLGLTGLISGTGLGWDLISGTDVWTHGTDNAWTTGLIGGTVLVLSVGLMLGVTGLISDCACTHRTDKRD